MVLACKIAIGFAMVTTEGPNSPQLEGRSLRRKWATVKFQEIAISKVELGSLEVSCVIRISLCILL